jgi:hypothetical protein
MSVSVHLFTSENSGHSHYITSAFTCRRGEAHRFTNNLINLETFISYFRAIPIFSHFLYQVPSNRTLMVSRFSFFLWIYTQYVGLLGRVIDPSQGLYLNTGQHKHRINARTHTPNIHAKSRIRTRDHSIRASEDI